MFSKTTLIKFLLIFVLHLLIDNKDVGVIEIGNIGGDDWDVFNEELEEFQYSSEDEANDDLNENVEWINDLETEFSNVSYSKRVKIEQTLLND